MNYLMRIKNVIDGLEPESNPTFEPYKNMDYFMTLNYLINLKTEMKGEENQKNETPVDTSAHEETVDEESQPTHEESKSTHEEPEEVMNNDFRKLSLILFAAELSASFLLTAKEQGNNCEVSSESLKAALSAAQFSKDLAEELKPGPHATSALNIAQAAIAATSTAQNKSAAQIESAILTRKAAELARLEEIKQKQNQPVALAYMQYSQRRYW